MILNKCLWLAGSISYLAACHVNQLFAITLAIDYQLFATTVAMDYQLLIIDYPPFAMNY